MTRSPFASRNDCAVDSRRMKRLGGGGAVLHAAGATATAAAARQTTAFHPRACTLTSAGIVRHQPGGQARRLLEMPLGTVQPPASTRRGHLSLPGPGVIPDAIAGGQEAAPPSGLRVLLAEDHPLMRR